MSDIKLNLVTATGTYDHVTSDDDGSTYADLIGADKYVTKRGNQFKCSKLTNTSVSIGTGQAFINGRYARLQAPQTLSVDSGASGTYRKDIVVLRYVYNDLDNTEECYLQVVKGNATTSKTDCRDATINDNSILDNPSIADMPLFRINIVGQELDSIDDLRCIVGTVSDNLGIIKNYLDNEVIPGTQYYLGERLSVSITLPDEASVGDRVHVVFYNGDTPSTVVINGDILPYDYEPTANTRDELSFLFDGLHWTLLFNEMSVEDA